MFNYEAFRAWVQKTLPLVYDDSLTYYEQICKIIYYLNDLYKRYAEITPEIQAAVAAKIDELIASGAFDEIISSALETAVQQRNLSGDIAALHVIPHYSIQSLTTAENGDIILTGSKMDSYIGGESCILAVDPSSGRVLDYKEFSGGHAGQIAFYAGCVWTSDYASPGGAGAKWWIIPYDTANREFTSGGWFNWYVSLPSAEDCTSFALDAARGELYAFAGTSSKMNTTRRAYVAPVPSSVAADVNFTSGTFDPAPVTLTNPNSISGNQSGQGWFAKDGNIFRVFNGGAVGIWERKEYVAAFKGFYNLDKIAGDYIGAGEFEKFHIANNGICYSASQFYLPSDDSLKTDPAWALSRNADGTINYNPTTYEDRYFVVVRYDLTRNVPKQDRTTYTGKTLTLNVKQYDDNNVQRTFLTEDGQQFGTADTPLYDIRLAVQIAISNTEQVVTINIIGDLICPSLEINETAQNIIIRATVPANGAATVNFGHVEIVGKAAIYGRKYHDYDNNTDTYTYINIEYLQVTGRGICKTRLCTFENNSVISDSYPGGFFGLTPPYIKNEAVLMVNACSTTSNDNILDVLTGSVSSLDFGRGTGSPGLITTGDDENPLENTNAARGLFGGYGFRQPGFDVANASAYTSNGWKTVEDANGNSMTFYPGKYSLTFGVPGNAAGVANYIIDITKDNRRGVATVLYTESGDDYMDIIAYSLGGSGANANKIYINKVQTYSYDAATWSTFINAKSTLLHIERVLD